MIRSRGAWVHWRKDSSREDALLVSWTGSGGDTCSTEWSCALGRRYGDRQSQTPCWPRYCVGTPSSSRIANVWVPYSEVIESSSDLVDLDVIIEEDSAVGTLHESLVLPELSLLEFLRGDHLEFFQQLFNLLEALDLLVF